MRAASMPSTPTAPANAVVKRVGLTLAPSEAAAVKRSVDDGAASPPSLRLKTPSWIGAPAADALTADGRDGSGPALWDLRATLGPDGGRGFRGSYDIRHSLGVAADGSPGDPARSRGRSLRVVFGLMAQNPQGSDAPSVTRTAIASCGGKLLTFQTAERRHRFARKPLLQSAVRKSLEIRGN
jgi:hypothetical protein